MKRRQVGAAKLMRERTEKQSWGTGKQACEQMGAGACRARVRVEGWTGALGSWGLVGLARLQTRVRRKCITGTAYRAKVSVWTSNWRCTV